MSKVRLDALLENISKLNAFLSNSLAEDGFVGFRSSEPGWDETYLFVNFETKQCKLTSWQISHHNGDAYGEKTRVLSLEESEEKLQYLYSDLFAEARRKVKAQQEAKRAEEEAQALTAATIEAVFKTKDG